MTVRQGILKKYVVQTPLALAFERYVESGLYATVELRAPVLDLGCGEGLFASLVFMEPLDYGVDPNARELARAGENGGHRERIHATGDTISLPDKAVATIVSNSVLEHIPDLGPVLAEARRLLRDDGRMFVTIPTDMFERYTFTSTILNFFGLTAADMVFRKKFNGFWAHYHAYEPEVWVQLFRRHGFTVERMVQYQPRWACMLNSFLTPFALPAFIMKRMINRWFLFPPLRQFVCRPLGFFSSFLAKAREAEKGGLIFFECSKDDGQL